RRSTSSEWGRGRGLTRACALVVLVLSSGCFRARVERRDVPVDTGVPLAFGGGGGPSLTWDFGGGHAPVPAPPVTRAVRRSGHYVVRGTDGDHLAYRIELDVIPRPVTRAVPGEAEWVLFSPRVKADFDESLDFFEGVLGASGLQSLIDGSLLAALAID